MKKLFNNYKSSFILLLSIILGAIIGIIFKEKILFLKPFGDLFINLLLVIVPPLIFLTITTSIGKMNKPKRTFKILCNIFIVFFITSLVSLFIGFLFTRFNLVDASNIGNIFNGLSTVNFSTEKTNLLGRMVSTISTNDFVNLLSKENIVALVVFSVIVGIAISSTKDKSKEFLNVLISMNNVMERIIKYIMYYAPFGLGCYFAVFTSNFGSSILKGYFKTFLIYLIACLFVYFIIYSIYAFLSGGKRGFHLYWKNITLPTLTALSTCSSAASIPVNIEATKNIGVEESIVNTTIPLGTSFHKDGSIIGSVFKIMFLVYLFNSNINTSKIILIALISTLLVTAIPIGGGTISELFIITLLGFPVSTLPILTAIATIIDAPATVLNVTGDTASSMIISRLVDGREWLNKK